MSTYDLGSARGEIVIDYRGDGTRAAESDLNKFQSKAGQTGQALDTVGKSTQRAGLAIAAGIGVAVASAANFESRMSAVQAVSGASAAEMDGLSKKALQLGKDTKFSASEAAQAIEELVKAGISVPDVMNGAADATVALAAAGEIELPQAAEIAANAMNQFKLKAQDMPRVADLLAGAANASAVSVTDLGESMKQVGPVAATLGVSLEETATAIAILGNNGIKGSSAGTKLRAIMSRLTPATLKAKDAMKELGIITKDGTNLFYDQHGSLKPLNEVIQILHDKTKGLTDQQKIAFTKKAFGLEAMDAASILMGETSQSMDAMTASLNKTTAADVAATRMDNLKGSLEQLKGSAETFLIVAGTPLIKAMRGWVDSLTQVANAIINMDAGTRNMIGKIILIAGAFLLVGGTLIRVVSFILRFVEALRVIGGAISALRILPAIFAAATNPIGLIILAVAALIAIFILLFKKVQPFHDFVVRMANAIKGAFLTAVDAAKLALFALQSGFDGLKGATGILGFFQMVGAAARVVWTALQQLWAAWKTNILPILQTAGAQIWNSLKDAWSQMAAVVTGTLWPAIKQLWDALAPFRGVIGQVLVFVLKLVGAFLLLGPAIALVVLVALAKLAAFLAPIAAAFLQVAAVIINVLIRAFTLIATTVVTVITAIVRFVTALITGFQTAIAVVGSIIAAIIGFFVRIATTIFTFVSTVIARWIAFWAQFAPIVRAAVALIAAIISLVFNVIKLVIFSALSVILTIFRTAWNAIRAVTLAVWNAIANSVQTGLNRARAVVAAVANAIRAVIVAVWRAISGNTNATWSSITASIRARLASARAAVAAVANAIRAVISAAWNAVRSVTVSAWNAIVSVIRNAINRAIAVVHTIQGRVKGALAGAAGWLVSAGRAVVQGFINGVSGMLGAAAAKVSQLAALARKAAASALKIGSPSKVFEDLGIDTALGYIKGVESMMAPVSTTVAATMGQTSAMAGAGPGPQQPQVNVAPAVPTVVLPEKMILRVGDREFTAYVQQQADVVLGAAAAKIGRGRK